MRILLAGVVAAATAGMAAGVAMRPVLWTADAAFPLLAAAESRPATEGYDEASATVYPAAKTPDYVIGTDWLLTAYREEAAAPDPAPALPPEPPAPEWQVYVALRSEPPAEPPTIPSRDGDILAGVGAPPSADEAAAED